MENEPKSGRLSSEDARALAQRLKPAKFCARCEFWEETDRPSYDAEMTAAMRSRYGPEAKDVIRWEGQCRRRAPIGVSETDSLWPETDSLDWCGEFVGIDTTLYDDQEDIE